MKRKITQNKTVYILMALLVGIYLFSYVLPATAQIQGTDRRYVRIGSLQNFFSAYGAERAWNNSWYEGLTWPSDYHYQDNAVIERYWIGADDFTDAKGTNWEKYCVSVSQGYIDEAVFPMELKQTARFEAPMVFVDGNNISAPYAGEVDAVDPSQIPDRIVNNVVNTSMGITITRRIYAFSQQYHENYFIKEYTYTNTGNTDSDSDIELNAPVKGFRVGWGVRYAVCYEGSFYIGSRQSWGQFSWVTKRGEDYAAHATEKITEADPIVEWIRCGFSWAGQSDMNTFDNIGGPYATGTGRLTAPQHAGLAVLHVDKSAADKADDPNQPSSMGWHAGDTYPGLGDMIDVNPMIQMYDMLSGKPYKGLGGTDRFDETYLKSITDKKSPWTVHNDGGGTNVWLNCGPFDLAPGESVTIVLAEGINGLNRQMCEAIGKEWKRAYDNSAYTGPFTLPDGSTTNDKDVYKNSWVYTGKDSILLTFGRAKRNYDANYQIPQPPQPPPMFMVNSGGDRISLSWQPSPSQSESGFAGYKIFRAVGKPDTTYENIYTSGPTENSFDDITAQRGFSYYYYIVAVNDGSSNTSGETNPTGQLMSSRFYTKTTEPAYLRRQAGGSLDSIRVVPNPYNIGARDIQFTGEQDKLMFLNIPGHCTIRIYTERGDLIETLQHENGSGDETWNSLTSTRQVIVSGIYIAHFTVTSDYLDPVTNEVKYRKGDTQYRKFIIIR